MTGATIPASTLRLLGGPSVVVAPGRRRAGQDAVALRFKAVEQLSAFLDAPPPQLLRVLAINERTALRRRERGTLTVEESDRLARIARVSQRAVDAFGDEAQARDWLRRPCRAFSGVPPLELLGTDAGAELVTDELGRIEYGELY